MHRKRLSRREFIRILGLSGTSLLAGSILNACAPEQSSAANLPVTVTPANLGQTLSSSSSEPDVEIALSAIQDKVQILPGAPTSVWRYLGEVLHGSPDAVQNIPNSYLGPIMQLNKGQTIRVHFKNELAEESIIHWHGLHVPVEADGHPRFAIKPGETYIYNFTVADRAGTYWFHPHPHGQTGPQVYQGLAGLFLIHDEEEQSLALPIDEYDLPLVIQDRIFDRDNQLLYGGEMMTAMMGFLGDQILVNGLPDYKHTVAARPYRLRLLNGSNSRIYKLSWEDGTPLTVIGTDGGLLEQPVQRDYITLAPAQRIELWVDFTTWDVGNLIRLVSLPSAAPGSEDSFPVMAFEIDRAEHSNLVLPQRLSTLTPHKESDAVNRRSPRDFTLAMGRGMSWTINGRLFEMTDVTRDEIVKLGDLEIWRFINQLGSGGMMGGMSLPHPMHIHGLQFQILERHLDRSASSPATTLNGGFVDEGWHDTVLVLPGEQVKVLLKFEDFAGLYLYHCHMLEHEDMGMMRNFRVDA
jgi:FtsP/CotA-like multicopper oxidase with cupredoxin domain